MRLPKLLALFLALLPLAAGAAPLTLTLPQPATRTIQATSELGDLLIPSGPFADGHIPGIRLSGLVSRTAWRIGKPLATIDLMQQLTKDVEAAGFSTVYACRDVDCGGFDFRYALPVLSEPDMHVDLGDYRFLAARRGDEAVTLLVSRAPTAAFVQISLVVPEPAGKAAASVSVDAGRTEGEAGTVDQATSPPAAQPAAAGGAPAATPQERIADLGTRLETTGHVALDDLAFASGKSGLEPGHYASLIALASWLAAHPAADVVLVGHTDSVGSLASNIALGKARATSVRQALIAKGVPAKQLAAEGVGYLAPRASNLTPEGRAKNRRVEVVLTSTQLPSATR